MRLFLSILFMFSTLLNAESMFSLEDVKKVYLVVEVGGKDIPKKYKVQILEQLKESTTELGLDVSGYDQRSLAVLVGESYVGTLKVVTVKLLIGEQVRREGSDAKSFAMTYMDSEQFVLEKGIDLEEKFEDMMDTLLARFSDQYEEENSKSDKVNINDQEFAKAMGYETNYNVALKRAKKEHKNIMLVLVANFCPWCRKFEQRVLLKKEVDLLVQKNYIPLIINKEKGRFPKELDRAFTPIVHFIDYKSAKSYATSIGYNNREEFLYLLKKGSVK